MEYDPENRLRVQKRATQTVTNVYSGDGLKRASIVNGTRTTLVWDGKTLIGEI
jgi:hypothetical protein